MARIPVSEVCQQALLAAVEAAESGRPPLGDAVAGAYRQGAQAGRRWARAASPVTLLTLLRDQRLDQIPTDQLPKSWYSLMTSSPPPGRRASSRRPAASLDD